MFKRLIRNKKAQNTAEYAILISLVVAGIIAMQTYAQRALQARVRDAGQYLVKKTDDLGNQVQYEPYYLKSDYTVVRNESDIQRYRTNLTLTITNSERTRKLGGYQEQSYNETGLDNGI